MAGLSAVKKAVGATHGMSEREFARWEEGVSQAGSSCTFFLYL